MRGEIRNVARAQQINDFSGLAFGKITPTDLDGVIEYHDKAFVYYEFKYLDADLPYGQRLCLERLVSAAWDAGKKAIALVVEHSVCDTAESVPAAQCKVRELYFKPGDGWRPPKSECTALEITKIFFDYVDKSILLGA